MSSNPPMRRELSALTSVERSLGSGLSIMVTPAWSHNHVSLSGCSTLAAWHITRRLTHSLTILFYQTKPMFGTKRSGGSTLENPATTQTRIWLASHFVRAPYSRSGVHAFESPLRRELGALMKVERSLGTGLSTLYNFINFIIFDEF